MSHVITDKDAFRSLLRKTGFKATPSRLFVLSTIQKAKRPLSAQDIIDTVKKEVDQATVYRILQSLKKKGIIRQIDLRHNHAHYEIAGDGESHHHLICTHCGRIEDVEKCDVEETYSAILRRAKKFSAISDHSLEFYGTCKTCNELK